jgi:hypothetical protein
MNIQRRSLARSALSRRRRTRQVSCEQTQSQVRRVEKIPDVSPMLEPLPALHTASSGNQRRVGCAKSIAAFATVVRSCAPLARTDPKRGKQHLR